MTLSRVHEDIIPMAHHEARVFPKIKEVRTFLIEGVGSGGDYHNVLHPTCYQKILS